MSEDKLCENTFERWAKEDPARLVLALTDGKTPNYLLTYAAEIAGNALPSGVVVPALVALLSHESAVVREGAIYGLGDHESAEVLALLADIAEGDPSPGVRCAALGAVRSMS